MILHPVAAAPQRFGYLGSTMFDEPEEAPAERPTDPATQAREKFDEFRMHAEFAAVFEGCRKFDAVLKPGLDAELAREVQKSVGRLEKAKVPDSPLISQASMEEAASVLSVAQGRELSTNDYHIHRRPGEVMIVRWLQGEQVETFYTRMQAHFDAALKHYREEERQSQGWKQDPQTLAYLEALDKLDARMADRYLRDVIRKHNVFILSTQSADELDILHLCDVVMGVEPAALLGTASAPSDAPTEQERAWFFKLFSLRGMKDGVEQMCFFTYLQKTDEGGW
ncbi:MAG: hypothetical protein H0T11_02915 [Chthoniobacterales bacterium]|nr:hypothetical protein [Chthoniobacterales bacterium]